MNVHKDEFDKFFRDELGDILYAEEHIVKALPNCIQAAQSDKLKEALTHHLEETRHQVERLRKVFSLIKAPAKKEKCDAIDGLIKECEKALKDYPASAVRDLAIIAKCQRIEHYEIAVYGGLCTYANELDLDDVASILHETLNEEKNADKTLSKLSEGGFISSGILDKVAK